jgi:hypothetical protein
VVALQLDHLAHTLGLGVTDDGAIAGWSRLVLASELLVEMPHTELLLDDLEDLLVIELRRNALHRGQGLTSITFCATSVSALRMIPLCGASRSRDSGAPGDVRWIRIWMYSWV